MVKLAVNTRRILDDILEGLGDVPIMEKYQLSPTEFRSILEKLKSAKDISEDDLQVRIKSLDAKSANYTRRALPRNYLLYSVSIFEMYNPDVCGIINDITEKGLQISGLDSSVDEVKNFLIVGSNTFVLNAMLMFEATCRWIRYDLDETGPIGGYEITNISKESLSELRRLIKELTVPELPPQGKM